MSHQPSGKTPADVLREFGRAVGVDVDETFRRVKENLAKLDSCQLHVFVVCGTLRGTDIPNRYRCSNCQGEVESTALRWYERGLAHGRAKP